MIFIDFADDDKTTEKIISKQIKQNKDSMYKSAPIAIGANEA